MRAFVLFLGFSGGLLIPGLARSAQGQTTDGPCLEPTPHSPGRLREPISSGLVPIDSLREPPSLFVSPQGKLCQSFRFSGGEVEAGPQVAMERTPEPGKAFLLSAILPGSGQWLLGQNRWPAYLAIELWGWTQFLDWRREGRSLQTQYKDLAWLVARRVSTGPRADAGWEYYEALTHFQASGAYDSDPLKPGVQPEEDPTTFNGSIWVLAQEIFPPEDAEPGVSGPHEQSYVYYQSRAYEPGLAWDWGPSSLHQEEYTGLIRAADEALRSSTGMVGVILANHLLSAVDALVSGRLGIAGEAEPSMEILLVPGPYSTRNVALQFRLPNPLAHGY